MYCTRFQVKGWGSFPLDMLRYDTCFPSTQTDVVSMDDKGTRIVGLTTYHKFRAPDITFDRWDSFMWSVVDKSISTTKI